MARRCTTVVMRETNGETIPDDVRDLASEICTKLQMPEETVRPVVEEVNVNLEKYLPVMIRASQFTENLGGRF